MSVTKEQLTTTAKHVLHALLFPFIAKQHQLKKIAAFVAFWYALLPSTAFLFPRAEEVLQREGLPPELVQELAPNRHIRVFQDTPLGATAVTLQHGPIRLFDLASRVFNPNISGFAAAPRLGSYGVCKVFIRQPKWYANVIGLRAEEAYRIDLLHEIRHCARDNAAFKGVIREGDADEQAVRVLARETNDENIALRLMFNRLNANPSHNTALYLDARLQGVTPPTADDLARLDQDLQTASTAFLACLQNAGEMKDDTITACRTETRPLYEGLDANPWFARYQSLVARSYVAAGEARPRAASRPVAPGRSS